MRRSKYIYEGIDGAKTEAEALAQAAKGDVVMVHYHFYGTVCNDKCHTVRGKDA